MKYKFNRRQIESVATFIATNLLLLILILWILYKADDYFQWDIIPHDLQRFIERFLITSIGGIVFICITISMLLNISLVSINIERLVDNKKGVKDEERTEISVAKKTRFFVLILILIIVFLIIGFKLWDKHLQNERVNTFLSTYATKKYLSKLEQNINKINYNDTLQYNTYTQNYKRIEMYSYAPLGDSNEKNYKELKSDYITMYKAIENTDKEVSLNMELVLSYNDYWLSLDSYSGIDAYSDNNETILLTSKQEIIKRIFGKSMENVQLTHNEGYDIYYRITTSKQYEFAIILNTKEPSILNFDYSIWR